MLVEMGDIRSEPHEILNVQVVPDLLLLIDEKWGSVSGDGCPICAFVLCGILLEAFARH